MRNSLVKEKFINFVREGNIAIPTLTIYNHLVMEVYLASYQLKV